MRRADPSDIAWLAALHARCFDRPWPEADFADHIARDLVFVGDHSLAVLRDLGGQAELLTLATDPEYRGGGLARAVLEAALAGVTSEVVFLEVAQDNAPAIALYTSTGFAVFGRRPRYYRRPDGRSVDALLMQRVLSGKVAL